MKIYLIYREDDAAGLALSLCRQIARVAPEAEVVSHPVGPGNSPPRMPAQGSILLLLGARGLRPAPGAGPYLGDPKDPIRLVVEAALAAERRIVPVLQGVGAEEWVALCRELRSELPSLDLLNACVIGSRFDEQVKWLVASLAAPATGIPWSENEGRTAIDVRMRDGGVLKWYSGRDKALTVFVDGESVGGLEVWNGRLQSTVEPGRHTVQIKGGRWNPQSEPLVVDVPRAETVSLTCERNIFTGGLSLAQKG